MMKNKWVQAISCLLFVLSGQSSYAAEQAAQKFTLHLPVLRETSQDYEAALKSFHVQLQTQGHKQRLVPVAEYLHWFSALDTKRLLDGWQLEQDKEGNVTIFGFWRVGEAFYRMELHGTPFVHGWQGTGTASMGTDPRLEQFPMKYTFQWSMASIGSDVVPEISKQVQYEGPAPEVVSVAVPSEEQMKHDAQNIPPINVLTVKALSYESPEVRSQQVARLPQNAKDYLKNIILSDLSWEEIQHLPGVIMLVDFLAAMDVTDQQRMAAAYARDGSAKYLKGHDFADLRDVPPAFLLVHCYPNLEITRKQQIRKASKRCQVIMDELDSRNNVSSKDLDDVMQEALSKMPKVDRDKFFASSKKLKSFVERSQNEKLKSFVTHDYP